jgi:hypothetical protein
MKDCRGLDEVCNNAEQLDRLREVLKAAREKLVLYRETVGWEKWDRESYIELLRRIDEALK